MIQQWEYKIEYKGINGTNAIVEYLNSMGAEGWENYQERERFYWFKRPIQQPSTAEKTLKNEVGGGSLSA